MHSLQSLEKISFDTLFSAFNEAFGDYEIRINKEELSKMLTRRGFVPELSFGAFENGKLTAFTLNGIGNFNGVKTAYDTGTGTLKEHRGKGLASKIFTHSLPFLKEAGVSQYLLEVLQHNTSAVSVYKKLGFNVSREFNYFTQTNADIALNPKTLDSKYCIREINLDNQQQMISFWDFVPSWQNSFDAIGRKLNDFIILGACNDQTLAGYCIFEPSSGDLTQIAVDRQYRREAIASTLLKEAMKHNCHDSVKVINTEVTCSSITSFVESCGIPQKGRQFEMIRNME